jgi:hypothetical protein
VVPRVGYVIELVRSTVGAALVVFLIALLLAGAWLRRLSARSQAEPAGT